MLSNSRPSSLRLIITLDQRCHTCLDYQVALCVCLSVTYHSIFLEGSDYAWQLEPLLLTTNLLLGADSVSVYHAAAHTANAAMQKGQGLRPLLHHMYETRARSYRDAIQEFVEGYKEGYVGQATVQPEKLKDVDSLTKPIKPNADNTDSDAVSVRA